MIVNILVSSTGGNVEDKGGFRKSESQNKRNLEQTISRLSLDMITGFGVSISYLPWREDDTFFLFKSFQ